MFKQDNAILIVVGEPKISTNWTNLYMKFRFENGEEQWLYYSEHVNKPPRLKQIQDFVFPQKYFPGTKMSVTYKIVQSRNKSTKLAIIDISNIKSVSNNLVRLDSLNVGDKYKYDLNDVGIFEVISKDPNDKNWIKTIRTQSGRVTGSFPWTEVYQVNWY